MFPQNEPKACKSKFPLKSTWEQTCISSSRARSDSNKNVYFLRSYNICIPNLTKHQETQHLASNILQNLKKTKQTYSQARKKQSKHEEIQHLASKTSQNLKKTNKEQSRTKKNKSKPKEMQHLALNTLQNLKKTIKNKFQAKKKHSKPKETQHLAAKTLQSLRKTKKIQSKPRQSLELKLLRKYNI